MLVIELKQTAAIFLLFLFSFCASSSYIEQLRLRKSEKRRKKGGIIKVS
jgi:hypothetical protein